MASKEPEIAPEPGIRPSPRQAQDAVRAVALLVSNSLAHRWLSRGDERDALAASVQTLGNILAVIPDLTFDFSEKSADVNGVTVEPSSVATQDLLRQCVSLNAPQIVLSRGLTEKGLGGLIEILCASASDVAKLGGFTPALRACGIEHIRSRNVVYREIAEDEMVVNRAEQESASHERGVEVANILAFLRGEAGAEGARDGARALGEQPPDARTLAEWILKAAALQADAPDLEGGRTLRDIMVGCVRRAHDAMRRGAAGRTQKGRRQLIRELVLLEKELLEALETAAGDTTNTTEKDLHEAIESLQDELQMDSLADAYIKKRKALDEAEGRVTRFLQRATPEDVEASGLAERLREGGIDPQGWQQLLIRADATGADMPSHTGADGAGEGDGAGGGEGEGGAAGSLAAVQQLSLLLGRMTDLIVAPHPDGKAAELAPALTEVIHEASREVDARAEQANRKIRSLARTLRDDAKAAEATEEEARQRGADPGLTRRQILSILAEMVQELCQPIAVINSAIDLLGSGHLGGPNDLQREMLDLAKNSTEKLKSLVDGLLEISGLPEGLTPETEQLPGRPPPPPAPACET